MGYLGNVRPTIALVADDITDGAITAAKIGTNAVTSDKINADAVTAAKIGADAVTSAKIGADQIGSSELNLGANYAFTGTITGAGGGKVLQVVSASARETSGAVSISTSYGDFVTCAITPAATANKILVLSTINVYFRMQTNSYDGPQGSTRVLRDSTSLLERSYHVRSNVSAHGFYMTDCGVVCLDSPSTTSQITYKQQMVYGSPTTSADAKSSFMILVEIQG